MFTIMVPDKKGDHFLIGLPGGVLSDRKAGPVTGLQRPSVCSAASPLVVR